jgi:hypothetical protein
MAYFEVDDDDENLSFISVDKCQVCFVYICDQFYEVIIFNITSRLKVMMAKIFVS